MYLKESKELQHFRGFLFSLPKGCMYFLNAYLSFILIVISLIFKSGKNNSNPPNIYIHTHTRTHACTYTYYLYVENKDK